MIHTYIGVHKQESIRGVKEKYPSLEYVYIDSEAEDLVAILSCISGQSLFGTQRLVVVNGVCSVHGQDAFEACVDEASRTADVFLFLEDKLLKKQKECVTKVNGDIVEEKKEEQTKDNRIYTAIQTRDKKLAWVALSYLYTIDTPEYAHGAVYTAYKSLLEAAIASNSKLTREETAFSSDWVYQKSIQASKLYTTKELEDNILLLARMLQKGHGDEGQKLDQMLERFILERV